MRRARVASVAFAATAVLQAGCAASGEQSADEPPPTSEAGRSSTSEATDPTTTSTTEVELEWFASGWTGPQELIDAGADERRELRYGITDITIDGGPEFEQLAAVSRTTVEGGPWPSDAGPLIDVDIAMTPRAIGDPILYVGRVHVLDSLFRSEPAGADSDEMRLRITPTGELELSGPHTKANDHVASTVAHMIPPLPQEPVGVGARWRASLHRKAANEDDPPLAQFEFVLVEDRGDEIRVDVTVERSRSLVNRGGVNGSVDEAGTGTVLVNLETARPSEARYVFEGTVTYLDITQPDRPVRDTATPTRRLAFDLG